MTKDELGLTGRGASDVAEAENTPIERIRQDLDRRGVNHRMPPGLKTRIESFRQKIEENHKEIPDDCPFDLTDEDRREIAEIERAPIEEIRRKLDERGVSHRGGATAVRRLIHAGSTPRNWPEGVWPRASSFSQMRWLALAKLAAAFAAILMVFYLAVELGDSPPGATMNADGGACGPTYADVGGPRACNWAAPQTTPTQHDK